MLVKHGSAENDFRGGTRYIIKQCGCKQHCACISSSSVYVRARVCARATITFSNAIPMKLTVNSLSVQSFFFLYY